MKVKGSRELGSENPISVSQYIVFLNEIFKRIKARIVGEVSDLKMATSGHVYFSLRDKSDGSVLRCVIWKSNYRICGVNLKEGMEIVVSGYADIYPLQGTFSFKAETIELVGEGALKKAYDELKEKLALEGVFDEKKKRPIPEYPRAIGVITSLRSGTVIHDFMSNLGKFGFNIKALDSRVEGQEAIKDLLACIKTFKKQDIDVLVIIRGGGSLQSLMAFDNEFLVREIAGFKVPVIAGIGHHKDITLSALAADACESTPTAVANLLNKSWESALYKVEKAEKSIVKDYQYLLDKNLNEIRNMSGEIKDIFKSIFENYRERERNFEKNLYKMKYSLAGKKAEIKEYFNQTFKNFRFRIKEKKSFLQEIEKLIESNNPERHLKMGYAIVKHNGRILKNASSAKVNDLIDLQFYKGAVVSQIKKIIK